jgi:anti-sigma factor RsiW
MDCRRAEELFSDHLEGTLAQPRLSELDRHLAACPDCRSLREALAEVIETLRSLPVPDAPAGLAERAATKALARAARASARPRRTAAAVPAWLQAAAAGIALLATGFVLLATGAVGTGRGVTRLLDRTASAGAFLLERKDRLLEDVRILGVVIATAFEGRLERMSDRVDDYRRLIERRRSNAQEQAGQKRSRGRVEGGRPDMAGGPPFSNQGEPEHVARS